MLVLTRKTKQQIQIGPDITITILQIKGQAVRVGIEAPRDVCVLRNELAEKLSVDSQDPTVMAALEKNVRESEISSTVIERREQWPNYGTGQWVLAMPGSSRRYGNHEFAFPVDGPGIVFAPSATSPDLTLNR